MTQDDPSSTDGDSNGGDRPASEQSQVAAAIKSLERYFDTARQNPTQYERKSHAWTIRTGKGVIIYTLLTLAITVAAIISAISSKTDFALQQRPWISVDRVELREPIVFRGPDVAQFMVNIFITNHGLSLAKNGFIWADVEPDVDALKENWLHSCQMVVDAKRDTAKRYAPMPYGFVVTPGESVPEPFGLSHVQVTGPRVRAGGFWIQGCSDYDDEFGLTHRVRFCFRPDTTNSQPFDIENMPVRHCNAFEDAN